MTITATTIGSRVAAGVSAAWRHPVIAPATVLTGAAAVGAVVWFADPVRPGGILPSCPIHSVLHLDCPGCGGTRAVYSLLDGDLGAALHYNAFAVGILLLLAVSFTMYTIGLWRGRPIRNVLAYRFVPMTILVVTLVWTVIRNLPFPPFESLKV
ncbi:MAG: DUF2752 domain-containing protein [Gordonia sp. (in: high G+C Gram-positive bacteria)]|uniref:DUF2752 domain-containing protein n=1 Tax=Gordonia sp. (in: high G+C Gram-positive bacteria) TaxID=84139 RepID=UPI0039E50A50